MYRGKYRCGRYSKHVCTVPKTCVHSSVSHYTLVSWHLYHDQHLCTPFSPNSFEHMCTPSKNICARITKTCMFAVISLMVFIFIKLVQYLKLLTIVIFCIKNSSKHNLNTLMHNLKHICIPYSLIISTLRHICTPTFYPAITYICTLL